MVEIYKTPNIDFKEIEKRKTETPQESYTRMKEQWRKEREQFKTPIEQANAIESEFNGNEK